MRWLVADSLYCPEAFFCSHLDSYSHYLREHGETVDSLCLNFPGLGVGPLARPDVAFVLDRYDDLIDATVRIAQVAAICSPMPWEVRKPDGSPAYDRVISSLRWMVEEARKAGCRSHWMPLAFDTRARACGMGVKRDLGCIFVGTVGPNHQKRARVVGEYERAGLVQVFPPTFGRDYFRLLARAKTVLNVHAEWARGEWNNMRMWEAAGMGALPVEGGKVQKTEGDVLLGGTYESRVERLVEIARECTEAKQ